MTALDRLLVLVARGTTAELLITMSMIPANHPDAELLDVCTRFDELQQAYDATDFQALSGTLEAATADAERQRLLDLQAPLVEHMTAASAVTWPGQVARARSLLLWAPDLMQDDPGDAVEGLTRAVLRDLAGVEVEAFRLERV